MSFYGSEIDIKLKLSGQGPSAKFIQMSERSKREE